MYGLKTNYQFVKCAIMRTVPNEQWVLNEYKLYLIWERRCISIFYVYRTKRVLTD